MSSVINASIDGLGQVPVFAEVTNQAVVNAYNTEIANLVNVFNKTTPIVESDYFIVQNAIQGLQNLAANGLLNTQTNSIEFITLSMANSINDITRSLVAIGFDPTVQVTAQQRIDEISQWRDLADVALRSILEGALSAGRFNRSLQAIIELEYVRTGNDQIFTELSSLEDATQLTQEALRILERAQNLKNMLFPEDPLADSPPLLIDSDIVTINSNTPLETIQTQINTAVLSQFASEGALVEAWEAGDCIVNLSIQLSNGAIEGDNFCTVEQFTSAYSDQLDPIFDEPISPIIDPSIVQGDGITPTPEALAEFQRLISELQELIVELDVVSPTGTTPRDTTIQGRIEVVVQDMQNEGLVNWVLDNYQDTRNPNAGDFQRNLTEAITTSESINDQQRQELRRQLFVFEEFYRSASAVLIAINQIITRMAQNISGR